MYHMCELFLNLKLFKFFNGIKLSSIFLPLSTAVPSVITGPKHNLIPIGESGLSGHIRHANLNAYPVLSDFRRGSQNFQSLNSLHLFIALP